MRILLLDNYDSFTWNIFHYVQQVNENIDVIRNDKIDLNDLDKYSHIILSPGPGLPAQAGSMPEVIKMSVNSKKILGICLGMQAVAEYFGGELYNLGEVTHGVSTKCFITKQDILFNDLPNEIMVGRYHSWAVKNDTIPEVLESIAVDEKGTMMAMRHKKLPVHGVQFHPESVLTPEGMTIIRNWIEEC